MGILGPSRDEILQSIAEATNSEFVKGKLPNFSEKASLVSKAQGARMNQLS